MAISVGFRNRVVGFALVASTILIFLPIILSKDMIKRDNPNAIAVNAEGALHNQSGELVYQSEVDRRAALNLSGGRPLTAEQLNVQQSPNDLLEGPADGVDNGVEIMEIDASGNPAIGSQVGSSVQSAVLAAGNGTMSAGASNSSGNAAGTAASNDHSATSNVTGANQAAASSSAANLAKQDLAHHSNINANPNTAANTRPVPPVQSVKPTNTAKDNGDKVIAGRKPSARYVVQVGVFSKRDNAENLVNKLKSAGIAIYAIQVKGSNSDLYRVYAGGSNNRDELNALVTQIQSIANIKGKVVPL